MNHDEPYYEKKAKIFSVVKKCPRCGQLSLSARDSELYCENCGFTEKIPSIR